MVGGEGGVGSGSDKRVIRRVGVGSSALARDKPSRGTNSPDRIRYNVEGRTTHTA